MKKIACQKMLPGLLAGAAACLSNATIGQNSPEILKIPNILLILVDDMGFGDLSCQGATDLHTPNIDRIFNQGMRFTNFYANSTVSSPTRASLLTGRYPDMAGVPGVIRTHADDSWGYLRTEIPLLPSVLKTAGYHTALIGKWHLGLEAPNLPNLRGFDHFQGFLGDMMDDYYTHLRFGNNYMRLNDLEIHPEGHATDIFTGWALDYLQAQKGQKAPFFLYLSYNAPHDPIQPPEEWLQKIKKRGTYSEKRAKLVSLIEHLDHNIGKVLDQLEESGQMENTLIIFTSDNGGVVRFEANNGPYRGGKQDMYEGGLRVAAGFMWKNHIAAGSRCAQTAITMDLFPTLCAITGITHGEPMDGISLWPWLSATQKETVPRTLFFVRREGNMSYGGMAYYAARSGEYKILQNTPWEPIQFFNLKEDPYEQKPLEKAGNKVYEELFKQLIRHIRLSGAVPWQKAE